MKIHLVTFATKKTGNLKYINSAKRLRHSALQNGVDKVYIYDEDSIKPFIDKHPENFTYKRGFGCYSWTAWVTLQGFLKAEKDDIVIYSDAAILITKNLKPLIDLCKEYKRLFFYVGEYKKKDYKNIYWSKKYIFEAMNCTGEKYEQSYQCMGGFNLFVKNDENLKFLEEFVFYCSQFKLVTDVDVPECPNHPKFVDHRHDQSILTNLINKYNYKIFRDPSQWGKNDPEKEMYPDMILCHRHQLPVSKKVAIITPTTGDEKLKKCMESVQKQTYHNITHYIVIDGPQFSEKANKIIEKFKDKNEIVVAQLPENTGFDRWNGHRIYGAFSFLVNADFVCFLDEDNWFEQNHVFSLLLCINNGKLDWAYSLRKIFSNDGKFITNDNCESLGNLHHTVLNEKDFLVDTSSYMVKTDIAKELGYSWNTKARDPNKMEVDRRFFYELNKKFPLFGSTCEYTLNYRTGNNNLSVQKEFFLKGNEIMKQNNRIKWDKSLKKDLFIIHFNAEKTHFYLSLPKLKKNKSYAYEEWQMSLLDKFHEEYNLKNAFTENIPSGGTVLVNMCDPNMLPVLLSRTDITKVCYTAEGPNIRHKDQWRYNFLKKYFTKVLTYYKPLLDYDKNLFVYCPFLHRLDLDKPEDKSFLVYKTKFDKSVCFVGENRKLSGEYNIDGVKLTCLDNVREMYVSNIPNIKLYGKFWDNSVNTEWKRERGHNINILKNYTFCLIVENNNANGYVSEKIYDAWVACCIPLYYGNAESVEFIPKDMYIDIKKIRPEKIKEYLSKMLMIDIKHKMKFIMNNRKNVLRKVSPVVYYETFKELL